MEIPQPDSSRKKRILVIKSHPREVSFCNDLVERYIAGARTNAAEIRILDLKNLALEPWLKYDWDRNHDSKPTSEDLERAKACISWSQHLTFAYPTYWAMPPALLAVFIEMVIVSGFAFKYHKPILGMLPRWDRLLKGRTATLLSTMDSPPFFMKFHDHDPGGKMMQDVLRFTGVKLTGKHYFGSVVLSTEKTRETWLTKAYKIGERDAREHSHHNPASSIGRNPVLPSNPSRSAAEKGERSFASRIPRKICVFEPLLSRTPIAWGKSRAPIGSFTRTGTPLPHPSSAFHCQSIG